MHIVIVTVFLFYLPDLIDAVLLRVERPQSHHAHGETSISKFQQSLLRVGQVYHYIKSKLQEQKNGRVPMKIINHISVDNIA